MSHQKKVNINTETLHVFNKMHLNIKIIEDNIKIKTKWQSAGPAGQLLLLRGVPYSRSNNNPQWEYFIPVLNLFYKKTIIKRKSWLIIS